MGILNETDWKSTLILNEERAVAAGIVWAVVMIIWSPPNHSLVDSLKTLYEFPLGYMFVLLPLGLLAAKLHESGIEWAGIFAGIVSLLIVVGDPLVYAASKLLPRLVPITGFKIFNRVLVLFVIHAR